MVKNLSIFLAISLFFCFNSSAQIENSSFKSTGKAGVSTTFASDYQAISINPSNLGWNPVRNKSFSIGLLEGAYSAHSTALTKQKLREDLVAFNESRLNYAQKIKAAENFANEGFQFEGDLSLLGVAFQNETIGGIGFRITERVQWYSKFNSTVSDILFRGYNAKYFDKFKTSGNDTTGISNAPRSFKSLFEDSKIKFNWLREYNLSYGRKIFSVNDIEVYGGLGLKYVQGNARIRIEVKDGDLLAYSATTPKIDIDYGDAANKNPSTVQEGSGILPKTVGNGWGLDLGASAVYDEKIKLGFAVNDIGSITWDGNVYELRNVDLVSLNNSGFDSYNIFAEVQDFTSDSGLFRWKGTEERETSLPTNMRVGASYEIIKEFLQVGTDVVIPFNKVPGNYERAIWAFGGDVRPIPWLKISTGLVTGGNYTTNIPVGIQFILGGGTYEFGIASRDAITFFRDQGPTLSLSTGFLRFRF